ARAGCPAWGLLAGLNRAFLHRAVRHLLAAGIRQFLDLGSWLPSLAPAHHVTQAR
ncbi:SAM-dependent methyltransferase, partial [Saccharothrix algeriensis]